MSRTTGRDAAPCGVEDARAAPVALGDVCSLELAGAESSAALKEFLVEVDLTLSGIGDSLMQIWVERDLGGRIVASTGFELSADSRHALIRSVAVRPASRRAGAGTRLASFALQKAAEAGASRAWLFSRRSGPFWQRLGFESADRAELARLLADTYQVRQFVASGQLGREVAWSRQLP